MERLRNLLTIGIALLVLPLAISCKSSITKRFAGEERQIKGIEVTVMPVTVSEDQKTVPYVGVAEASQNAQIVSPNSGRIEKLRAKKGSSLKKGDEICYVKSALIQSAYDMAKSTLKQAQDGYDRMMKVYKDGGVTELKKMEVETQLMQAKAAFMSAKESLAKCHVLAPYDGVVEEVYVEQGIDINPLTPVVRLSNTHETLVTFPVPENEISHVAVGQEVSIVIPAIDKEISGKIIVKGNIASPISHTYECSVVPDKNLSDFLPGMICKVFIQAATEHVIVIPVSSVMIDEVGKYVWTVTDGVVGKNRLVLGGFASGGVIVQEGLEPGDQVVVEGRRKISTGMKVGVQYVK